MQISGKKKLPAVVPADCIIAITGLCNESFPFHISCPETRETKATDNKQVS